MELLEGQMKGTPISERVSTKLQRIAELAREDPERSFLSLAHHIDIEFLREAFRRTRKDGATGVDDRTAAQYEARLGEHLESLHERLKSGTYFAPPVRRAYIRKGDGKQTRPIGIPTFEDKVLQRAVAMVLEAVYEQDFLDCSHGFRPGRSAHQALEALWRGLMQMGGGWVLEVDITSFFDTLEHRCLRNHLDRRVRDGVLRRMIHKWLKAGVLEGTELSFPSAGTPQGGVISPLLANVYLHEVLDKWFHAEIKPRLRGRAFLIRYADDFALVFSTEQDARRVMGMLPKRFGEHGLTLHPGKTRLLYFRPQGCSSGCDDDPGSFDFLGFRHVWSRSRRGRWVVKRKTAPDRFGRTLKRLRQWLRKHRHRKVRWQHARLVRALKGHDAYFGLPGNLAALRRLRFEVARTWRYWLDRRGGKRRMAWERFKHLLSRYPLPPAALRVARTAS
jgi:group II intron reverse transcriptase/maturase